MTQQFNSIDPIDAQVGGDGDIGGIARTITSDDVQAVLLQDRPVSHRLDALKEMRVEIAARSSADRGADTDALLADIEHAIAALQPV